MKGVAGARPVAVPTARRTVVVPVAVAVGMMVAVAAGMAVSPVVALDLLMPAVSMVPEPASVLAAIGESPAGLAVGLPGVAPRVVPSVGGGGAGNGAGRDHGGGAKGENCK